MTTLARLGAAQHRGAENVEKFRERRMQSFNWVVLCRAADLVSYRHCPKRKSDDDVGIPSSKLCVYVWILRSLLTSIRWNQAEQFVVYQRLEGSFRLEG